jgi:HEAT repeat protein
MKHPGTISLTVSLFTLLLSAEYAVGQPRSATFTESVEAIRAQLEGHEFDRRVALIRMGERVFPAFQAILADPKTQHIYVSRIFVVLEAVKADRRQFVGPVVRRLSDPNSGVRGQAVRLLAHIGSEREIPPIVALLSDTDITVGYGAATALLAIGNERAVDAMTVWLNSGNHRVDDPDNLREEVKRGNEVLRQHVAKCRDELKQRLEMTKITK